MRWFWITLRWVAIAVGTFLVAGAFGAILVPALRTHDLHVRAWMVWTMFAVAFILVWGVERRVTSMRTPVEPDLNTLRRTK